MYFYLLVSDTLEGQRERVGIVRFSCPTSGGKVVVTSGSSNLKKKNNITVT